jgi:outer membrane protein TolC
VLFRTQATLQVLEATVKRSEEQLERARALFQAGRFGKNEEITALVNLGNDRITFTQTLAQLVTDQTQLAIWLARPGTEALQAVDPGVLQQEPAPAPAMDTAPGSSGRCSPRSRGRCAPRSCSAPLPARTTSPA